MVREASFACLSGLLSRAAKTLVPHYVLTVPLEARFAFFPQR